MLSGTRYLYPWQSECIHATHECLRTATGRRHQMSPALHVFARRQHRLLSRKVPGSLCLLVRGRDRVRQCQRRGSPLPRLLDPTRGICTGFIVVRSTDPRHARAKGGTFQKAAAWERFSAPLQTAVSPAEHQLHHRLTLLLSGSAHALGSMMSRERGKWQ